MTIITRREKMAVGTMTAYMDGSFSESTYEGYLWRCDGCGLVWERHWHAEKCAERGHCDSFVQTYYGRGPGGSNAVVNGVFQGSVNTYTRRAVRREDVLNVLGMEEEVQSCSP
jgi:hypothetical protein